MKDTIIAYDSGIEIYADISATNSNNVDEMMTPSMMCALFSQIMAVTDNMQQQWESVTTNSSRLVFAKRQSMYFFIVTDEGDSEIHLRNQIDFMQNLLIFLFSNKIFASSRVVRFTDRRIQSNIGRLFKKVNELFSTSQGFLLNSIERIFANKLSPLLDYAVTHKATRFFSCLKLHCDQNIPGSD